MILRLSCVHMIWDQGPHNAFTDLIRWRDRFYCAFREGSGHAEGLGTIRVLASGDGENWEPVGVLQMEGYDLRDAHLAVTPDDRLMVLGGAAIVDEKGRRTGTFAAFSEEGRTYSRPQIVVAPGRWLWQVTWHKGRAYGVSYDGPGERAHSSLLVSDDGITWTEHVPALLSKGWPTEATVRFDGDVLLCLHRRDGEDNSAHLGVSEPPYEDFTWHDLGRYYGGPNLIEVPGIGWIGAGRIIEDQARTVLTAIDADAGTMTPLLELPSGGDTSYPGLVWHNDLLWVSYYSSHEAKTSIYVAQVRVEG